MSSLFIVLSSLPEEVVERVAAGVDFGYHLVEVTAKFVDSYLFACGNKDTWCVFLCYPAVLELLKSVVLLSLRLKRKLIILLVSISVYLIENHNLLPLS